MDNIKDKVQDLSSLLTIGHIAIENSDTIDIILR